MWLNRLLLKLDPIIADARISTDEIVRNLNVLKPDVIYSSPSIIEKICNVDTLDISPRLVFNHGGVLTEHCRKLVKSTLSTEVYDTYGSAEFWRIAFECKQHLGLHIITDCVNVECIKEDESVAYGEPGEVVITGLYNYCMPLIRYNLEDIAILTNDNCTCGRSWPLMKVIQGRKSDSFRLPNGRILSASALWQWLFPEIKEYIWCFLQYQLIQESINKIVLKIVKGREYRKEILDQIIRKIKKDLEGEEVTFSLEIVDAIEKKKSGKLRHIISYVN
jgi:phenylacetate-CoA ligase